MGGRPEILFPLFASPEVLPGIGPKSTKALAGIGIEHVIDMALHLPISGIDRRRIDTVQGHPLPGVVTLEINVEQHLPARSRGRPHRVLVSDGQVSLHLIYFHAQAEYLERLLPEGAKRVISGRAEMFDGMVQMPHPDHVLAPKDAEDLPMFEPVHGLTAGVTQKAMRRAISAAIGRVPELGEWIDGPLLDQKNWPGFSEAITQAQFPQSQADVNAEAPARQRLAYDELFAHQLTLALVRAQARGRVGRESKGDGQRRAQIEAELPYTPTAAQHRATEEILADMAAPHRMMRLLQGDVGAGKTLVALMALTAAVEAGGQGALMAPTEVLARQHLKGLQALAAPAGLRIDVLTGRDKGATRAAKLKALAAGDIDILVGTHALFQEDVMFSQLRLAVIDEQHRFGVRQRLALGQKGDRIDTLVMTATPIPRSLALAHYGDMDLSVLDEKPPGRTPVRTVLIPETRRDDVIERLRSALNDGAQAYWVCPLVHDSEITEAASAEARFAQLRAAFGDDRVGLVHGQLAPEDKDAAMAKFAGGETQLLVATTVIEVGVDVPNATIMVIERAETFGLAQLHQLRGRVGRGSEASTCLLIYQPPLSESGQRRLEVLRGTEDGFVIAETDLQMRGTGDLIGTAQSGVPRFRVADLERQASLMATAQSDARKLLADDPALQGDRGKAARMLLWLMRQDEAFRLISVG